MIHVFSCNLFDNSIDDVIAELRAYQTDLTSMTEEFARRVAEEIAEGARIGFAGAITDVLIKGGSRSPSEISVSVEHSREGSIVIASGEDAIWCEFGTGVHFNGAVGSSPHPKGVELGFTIGTYGKGLGSRDTWGFYENGQLVLTHGAPAAMPMYRSMRIVCEGLREIAAEVFNG